jgi:hypothetical protein
MDSSSTASKALNLADGPNLRPSEVGVHIIYMSAEGDVPESSPTDIVVYDGKPWHMAGLPGHQKERRAHPQVHIDFPGTVLVISIDPPQQAVWWSEVAFTITSIKPSKLDHKNRWYPEAATKAPDNPFAPGGPPIPKTVPEKSVNRKVDLFVARSTPPIPDSNGHMYKIEFTMDNKSIDPDMYCGAP